MRSSLAIAVVGSILVACGDDGAPPPADARAVDAAVDARADASTGACAVPSECPCFSNYDCPQTHTCVSQDPSGTMVYCVEGQRGTGAPGTPCTGEQDCASALCVEDATNGMRCSDVCTTADTCPSELPRCIFLGGTGLCARQP